MSDSLRLKMGLERRRNLHSALQQTMEEHPTTEKGDGVHDRREGGWRREKQREAGRRSYRGRGVRRWRGGRGPLRKF